MSEWIFASRDAAEAAADACAARLSDDVLLTGKTAPTQVTERWATPAETVDGRWMFPGMPGSAIPVDAVEIADADAELLRADLAVNQGV